ncbi:Protein of unknown function [Flavobacterium johnsoniae]|uniref:DUF2931 family protein n=2 Tax=Flavobacterium johnsoniae TaxID=986 RepID=A0A1M5J8C2_FLAJO|nr:Protein of unknown function [Flavobacterium johnsoniae]
MKRIYQLLCLIMILSCNNTNKKDMKTKENFSWGVAIIAPRMYPIEIHKGYLGNDKKMIAPFINTGLMQQGWAYYGDVFSGGNEMPTELSATWISYAEKKFWKIETEIDKKTQDKIRQLFIEGYENKALSGTWSHITYKKITIGLAPGGIVILWASGLNKKTEIAHYQAKETFVSVNEFCRNPDEYTQQEFYDDRFEDYVPKETQEYIKKNGVPLTLYEEYRTKYNYRFDLQFHKTDKESNDRESEYVNGEKEIVKIEDLNSYQTKALPSYCRFWFSQYNAEAEFDGGEILNAFKKISKNHPDKNIDIEAKVAFMYKTVDFIVKCEGEEIPLQNVVVRMWKN